MPERSESVMAEMRANDAVEQLKVELARLKDSHAALLAIAITPKPVEIKPVVPKKKPAAVKRRASVYWWIPSQAAFSSASQRRR